MGTGIKAVWSGIDVSKTGIFTEAFQAQLVSRIWTDAALQQDLVTHPKLLYAREIGVAFPSDMEVKVLEESPDIFYFIVPNKPADEPEILARLGQMSGWWMAAHTWWWWMSRTNAAQANAFREALQAMIIGHIWMDHTFRQAMQFNPKATLEAEIGISFPADLQIKMLEETSQITYLVLPQPPKSYELNARSEQFSEWWMAAHNWWWWLIWLRIHTEIYSI